MNIIKPSIPMRSMPDENSMLETECLFGEKIEIIKKSKHWLYCKLKTDNYAGWIKNDGIGILEKPTHRIAVVRTFIFSENSIKSNCLHYLSLGSKIKVKSIEDEWALIHLSEKHKTAFAYIRCNDIVSINSTFEDWISIAEKLVGTPYRWGGRDTIGIDCSALLQLSYQTSGKTIPRNTSEQVKLEKRIVANQKDLVRGSVVFWEGHVGIMVDQHNIIHANAHHMATVIEPLDLVINRMKKNKVLKIMNFN